MGRVSVTMGAMRVSSNKPGSAFDDRGAMAHLGEMGHMTARSILLASAALALLVGACGNPAPSPVASPVSSTGIPIRTATLPDALRLRFEDVEDGIAVGTAWFANPAGGENSHAVTWDIAAGAVTDIGTFGQENAVAQRIDGDIVSGVANGPGMVPWVLDLATGKADTIPLVDLKLPASMGGDFGAASMAGVDDRTAVVAVQGVDEQEVWRSFAYDLDRHKIRDLGALDPALGTAAITVGPGIVVGWSQYAVGKHAPVVIDLASGEITNTGILQGGDLGLLADVGDGWAVGWNYAQDKEFSKSIAWNLAGQAAATIGDVDVVSTANGWAVGSERESGQAWVANLTTARRVDLGTVDGQQEVLRFDGRWMIVEMRPSDGTIVAGAWDLADATR